MPISWFYWDPNPVAFTIPFINLPVFIYGLFFVAGFFLGYYILLPILTQNLAITARSKNQDLRQLAQKLIDKLAWFVIGGTVIGARLGHVFFYDWDRYKHNLIAILNTREGGLASHGGAIGVILSLLCFYHFVLKRFASTSLLQLIDMIVIPAALVGCFIRIGNFFNQEIVGIPSQAPWAVVFGHPADGGAIIPRHAVQLYEAAAYLFIFISLYSLWQWKKMALPQGVISGLFFLLVFSSRFVLEFWKAEQTAIIDQNFLQMGQILSLPFIFLGIALLIYARNSHKQTFKSF
ncbi:MAG: prolipoprotein diacylglyceryl transferase [Parachlamydiaceae bacterium]